MAHIALQLLFVINKLTNFKDDNNNINNDDIYSSIIIIKIVKIINFNINNNNDI